MKTIPLGILGTSSSLFKCNSLKNEKLFLNFLFHLWNLNQILKILKRKMIVIANEFRKLQAVKDLIKPLSRKRRFKTSIDSECVNGCQTLVKSAWENSYHIFWSPWGKMMWKISRLFKLEILGVFVNTLAALEGYAVWDCEKLQFHIQMQLS